jgi:hypothetical protein
MPTMYQRFEMFNPGILMSQIPTDVLLQIKDVFKNDKPTEPYNKNLIGHIKEEYHLDPTKVQPFTNFLNDMFVSWRREYGIEEKDFALDKLWVNFQKKHEFNPTHWHYGVASFVLWVQIPYDINEELKQENCKNVNGSPLNSMFQFSYQKLCGGYAQHHIPVDKSYEGTILMFPADMIHCVYPFYTSDDYRISISGNLYHK